MIYLLVTGGASGKKKHMESFDFSESQWSNVSQELIDFVKDMVVFDPKKREKVSQLLKSPFIKRLETNNLRLTYLSQTIVDENGENNLIKFSVAAVIN